MSAHRRLVRRHLLSRKNRRRAAMNRARWDGAPPLPKVLDWTGAPPAPPDLRPRRERRPAVVARQAQGRRVERSKNRRLAKSRMEALAKATNAANAPAA
jgi:hypothetical protein